MHEERVAILAWHLAKQLVEKGMEVDILHAINMAEAHDDLEVITGDIPSPEKRKPARRKQILQAEREAARALDREFKEKYPGVPRPFGSHLKLFRELTKEKTIESQIVKVADHIDGLGETFCEIILGNDLFLQVLEDYWSVFEEYDRKYPWWRDIKQDWGLGEFPTREKALEIREDESLAPAFYKVWLFHTEMMVRAYLARQERMEKRIAEIRAKAEGDTGA